jgi:tetratricopeptide (TPR) repeat protein
LKAKGQVDEAIACFQKAIALDPKFANAHTILGNALRDKGQLEEAIACYHKAIALGPKSALVHHNLGNALRARGRVDEAIASWRKAIACDPNYAQAYANLGNALTDKGRVDEAIACCRKAIELDPKLAQAHYNLGNALSRKDQLEEAVASYQKAIALDPKHAEAHCNLAGVLQGQGRFAESLAAFRRGHELGRKQPGWRYPSALWVRRAERLAALEAKLPAFLKGEYQPRDMTDRLGLVVVCQARKLHAARARLYAAAFSAEPKLADFLPAQHRYAAACSAALAAVGRGEDAAKLDGKERARLRKQALGWLRADLAVYTKLTEGGPPAARAFVQQQMGRWQKDSGLAGLRDREALARLPAEERAACERLWADVAALLKKAEAPAKKEGKP